MLRRTKPSVRFAVGNDSEAKWAKRPRAYVLIHESTFRFLFFECACVVEAKRTRGHFNEKYLYFHSPAVKYVYKGVSKMPTASIFLQKAFLKGRMKQISK